LHPSPHISPVCYWRGHCFLHSLPFWSKVFLLTPWLLLDLTGLNWGQLEILEKTQNRQTDRQKVGVRCVPHNPHWFFFFILIL
jgi:hypothetical protein